MDDRLGREVLTARLRDALATADVPHADLYVRRTRRGFARYAINTLSQHAEILEETVTARAGTPSTDGYKLASVTSSDLSRDGLVNALRLARRIADEAETVPGWPGFAAPEGDTPELPRFVAATAECTPMQRAQMLLPALARARAAKLTAAGFLETSTYESAVANTAGVARHADGTVASFKMFAHDRDGVSGFAQKTHRDVTTLDLDARAAEACAKSLAGHDPISLEAGTYDVVLEPPAVVELLEWLSFVAFGAREVADGTSMLAGRAGERIAGENVSVIDDACDRSDLGLGVPFDREGVLRERVVLIDRGVAREPVYDRLFAARAGKRSTGHAGPPGGDDTPIAQALRLDAGSDTLAGLHARVDRGLHITRLHYVNGFLDPRRALMTGLTRDGTFLIERGERTRGVRNMRFTESILEALARIDGITALRDAVPTWWSDAGAYVAPAVLIRGFRFTGGGVSRPTA